jgi:diguanylate cyclase (GGDEF)-like protein/PAS domain S-box-containing protein
VPVGIWTAAANGPRNYFNRGWLDFTGRTMADELSSGWLEGVHPDDREYVAAAYAATPHAESPFELEYRLRRHDRQYRWIFDTSVPRRGSDGATIGSIGACLDITERKQSQLEIEQLLAASDAAHSRLAEHTRRLHRLAETDALTGLLNRRSFREQSEREWVRALRYERPLACIMADIDFFKRVNDSHGHAAGDATLTRIAQLFARQCRPSDLVCRYGGEEFCILAPETNEPGAARLAERMRQALADTPIQVGGVELRVTSSFGVADCVGELNTVDELVERADRMLHVAKNSGRNQVLCFASEDPLVTLAAGQNPVHVLAQATARDLLTPTPCIPGEATVAEAIDILLDHRTASAPVVDAEGKLAGFVSERDLMLVNVSPAAWNVRVRDVMKSNLVCYQEDAPGQQVFQFLCRALIHRVVIAEGGRPIGVISPSSLLHYFRQRVGQEAPCCGSPG